MRLVACLVLGLLSGCCWRNFYSTGFETAAWGFGEEIIAGDDGLPVPCPDSDPAVPAYAAGLGVVSRAQPAARSGDYGLLVHANAHAASRSNHVAAWTKLSATPQNRRFRYSFDILIPDLPDDAEFAGQVAPDFSLQNTKWIEPGKTATFAAGLQQIVDPTDARYGEWNVFVGGWTCATEIDHPLQRGVWHRITLAVDFAANRYEWVRFEGPDGTVTFALDRDIVGIEKGWGEESFLISLEAENQWSGCAAIRRFWVYFDNVLLKYRRRSWFCD